MRIELKKGRDGRPSLTCVRADGSRTWSKLHPFFPVHDITHCAVESVLGLREAFFGLIASGRSIEDFQIGGAAATLPPEALRAEHIVGILDLERAGGTLWSAEQFNAALAAKQTGPITEAELQGIRALRGDLTARWMAVPPGETLSIPFPASSGIGQAGAAAGPATGPREGRG